MSDDAPSQNLVKDSGKLSLLTLVSRILGLVREMTRAAFMGTGALADAFTIAFVIPNFLRRLFAEGSVSVAFIPTFKAYIVEGDKAKTERFLSSMLSALLLLVVSATALGMAATPLIVGFFKSEPVETAVLTRIMFPFLTLVSVAALFQGVLNSVGVFTPSGMGPIWFNVCFIALPSVIAPLMPNPARAMAVGVLVGGLAQCLCQLPAVLKAGFRLGLVNPFGAFKDAGVQRVLALIAPTILGMAAYQMNEIVCTGVANAVGVGVATSLTYSLRLLELFLGVFVVSLGSVLLPELTDRAVKGEWRRFSEQLMRALDAVALISIPVTAYSMVMGREIVELLFKAKEFDARSVDLTSGAFFFHILGLFFIAANRILAPGFYARGDTKRPTMAGIASFAVNIPLAFALGSVMGGGGVALALSIASLVNTLILVKMLLDSGLEEVKEALLRSGAYVLRLALFSVLAALPVILIKPWFLGLVAGSPSRFISAGLPVLLSTLIFACVGLGLLVITRDATGAYLLNAVRRRGKGKRDGA